MHLTVFGVVEIMCERTENHCPQIQGNSLRERHQCRDKNLEKKAMEFKALAYLLPDLRYFSQFIQKVISGSRKAGNHQIGNVHLNQPSVYNAPVAPQFP